MLSVRRLLIPQRKPELGRGLDLTDLESSIAETNFPNTRTYRNICALDTLLPSIPDEHKPLLCSMFMLVKTDFI